jgi:hypothetical protein
VLFDEHATVMRVEFDGYKDEDTISAVEIVQRGVYSKEVILPVGMPVENFKRVMNSYPDWDVFPAGYYEVSPYADGPWMPFTDIDF